MAKQIPFDEIVKKAEHYKKDMTRFLRDMVAIPSESCDEKRVIHRIKEEMKKSALIKWISTRWGTFWVISVTVRT